jgi:serine phosphatase RsbU (regulator of sigma subunit)
METRAGDVLVLYSDGVLDAVGAPDRFGPDRLKGALTSTSCAPDAIRRLDHALADFQLGPQSDDIAVLAIERRPTRGARQVAVAANDPYER